MSKQEWEIVKSDFDTYYVRESEGSYIVERVIAEGICSLDKARLIAAAPDLLEALQQAVTSMQDSGYPNDSLVIRAARQAITKATA